MTIAARLCIRKQQSRANHSAEPTLIHVNAALSIADDFFTRQDSLPIRATLCAWGLSGTRGFHYADP
jgi:hypothetical protein